MGVRLAFVWWLVAVGCSDDAGGECEGGQLCDGFCVPAASVCCNEGNGAVCPVGYTCVAGTDSCNPGDAVTIDMQGTDQLCPSYVPNPASVGAGQALVFTNSTTVSRTIVGRQASPPWPLDTGTPWVSVDPGGTSGAISFESAGSYSFTTSTHVPSCTFGELFVTVN